MDSKLALEHAESVMALALAGAKQIHVTLKDEVKKYAHSILHTRGLLSS
jgi:hypothetical protein